MTREIIAAFFVLCGNAIAGSAILFLAPEDKQIVVSQDTLRPWVQGDAACVYPSGPASPTGCGRITFTATCAAIVTATKWEDGLAKGQPVDLPVTPEVSGAQSQPDAGSPEDARIAARYAKLTQYCNRLAPKPLATGELPSQSTESLPPASPSKATPSPAEIFRPRKGSSRVEKRLAASVGANFLSSFVKLDFRMDDYLGRGFALGIMGGVSSFFQLGFVKPRSVEARLKGGLFTVSYFFSHDLAEWFVEGGLGYYAGDSVVADYPFQVSGASTLAIGGYRYLTGSFFATAAIGGQYFFLASSDSTPARITALSPVFLIEIGTTF